LLSWSGPEGDGPSTQTVIASDPTGVGAEIITSNHHKW